MDSGKKVSPNVGSKRSRKSKEEEAEPEAPEQDEEERFSKRTKDGAGKSNKITKKNEGAAEEQVEEDDKPAEQVEEDDQPAKPKRKKKKISAEQENRSGNEQVEEDEKPAEQADQAAKPKRKKKKTKEIPATSGNDEESALMEYEKQDEVEKKAEPNRMEGAVAQRADPPDELKARVEVERLKALPSEPVFTLNEVYALHTKIVDCFEGRSSTQAMDRLSDPSVLSRLVVPSLLRSDFGPPMTFTYVGRKKLKELQKVLHTANRMRRMGGYSGRGKTYMMAAMACYLHAYENELGPVVYIQASRLVGRFDYLVSALLLAYVRHPDKQLEVLARASSEVRIQDFCEREGVFVLMDEVNAFDTVKETSNSTKEDREKAKTWIQGFHNGIRCASYKSTFQSCTRFFELDMNEPFDLVELASWQRSEGFLKEDPEELLQHTGLVPRILQMYTENKERDKAYRRRRLNEYLAKIETAQHYVGAMEILNGQESTLQNPDADIFYERSFGKDDSKVSVLPYLQAEMTVRLEEKRKAFDLFENFDHFISQRTDVRAKLKGDSERGILPVASLNGWLAESLTRECILLRKKFLRWHFKTTIVYKEERDGKIEELVDLSDETLKAGVCFVPRHCDAEDADLFVVKLKSGSTLKVHAVQISVSAWKARKRKDSHEKFLSKVDRIWARVGCTVAYDFTYVLPNSLQQDVKKKVTRIKFADVDKWLSFIDELQAPELELRKCKGRTKEGNECRQVKYQANDYYCQHHMPRA